MSTLNRTNIPWAGRTWSPGRGCRGCEIESICWAKRTCWRMAHNSNPQVRDQFEGLVEDDVGKRKGDGHLRWTGTIRTYPEAFDAPFRTRKPQVIFVWPHGDIAHADAGTIRRVFGVALVCEEHEFLFLTKWPEMLLEKLRTGQTRTGITSIAAQQLALTSALEGDPEFRQYLDHLWLGVSATDQETYDQRVGALCHPDTGWLGKCFVSIEPCIGPIDIGHWFPGLPWSTKPAWIITGSADTAANGAAAFTPEIARSFRDQSDEAGIPFWLKQAPWVGGQSWTADEGRGPLHWMGKVEQAPFLDGRQHLEAPPAIAAILRREGKLP